MQEMIMMIMSELFFRPHRRMPYSIEDIEKQKEIFLDKYNGKKDMYEAVYLYNGYPDEATAIVDKIFLDFDPNDDMSFVDDVKTVAKYLYENGIIFYMRFSGRGFHIFIELDTTDELLNPKYAIKKYVKHLHSITNTTSDPAVVGDVRRVTRLVNSMNLKTRKYCIPISYEELLNNTYEDICKMASHVRHTKDYIYGNKYLCISDWDIDEVLEPVTPQNIIQDGKISNDLPPCIENFLQNPQLSHMERVQLILFFRDLGYTQDEIEGIFHSFLSDDKFHHCVNEEHQIQHVIEKNYLFSNCDIQKLNGFCPSEECAGCNLYY